MRSPTWSYFLCSLLATSPIWASPAAPPLLIQTSIGTFQGFANATAGFEAWLGVPYAQPPVGKLRFKAPVSITRPFKGVQDATSFGDACPQPVAEMTSNVQISENCLVLNIFRPAGTRPNAKLPVLIWMHGGAYNVGASSDPMFNSPAFMFERATTLKKPFIFISINYRVNTFGFLASGFISPEDLNMGLQDQVVAFRFVRDQIRAFGGDPEKVKIWGQSAGAGSVEAHVLYPTKDKLFRAGIMNSATGPFKSAPFPQQYDAPGKTFGHILDLVGCPPPSSVGLECLRAAPFPVLLNATNFLLHTTLNHQVWQPTIGPPGTLVPERASARINSGNFLKIPLIMGTNLNEGTTFSQAVLGLPKTPPSAEALAFNQFIGDLILDNTTLTPDVLNAFNTLYPANDPSLGGAFNTGDSLFDRAEAWYSDNMFLAPRRFFFDRAAAGQQLFGYFYTEFFPGANRTMGVAHASELPLIFGGFPESERSLANTFTDAYVTFVSDLNPGSFWPTFNTRDKSLIQLMKGNVTVIRDDFLITKTNFLNTQKVLNEFEK